MREQDGLSERRCRRCGKIAYPTARRAWKVARVKRGVKALAVYRCPVGNGWHVKTMVDKLERRRSWGWRRKLREAEVSDE